MNDFNKVEQYYEKFDEKNNPSIINTCAHAMYIGEKN